MKFIHHRRKILWIALPATLLIALPLAGICYARYRAERDWQAYRAEAIARGVQFEFAHFIPPPLPPEENFAEIPHFRAAFNGLSKSPALVVVGSNTLVDGIEALYSDEPIDIEKWRKEFTDAGMVQGEQVAASDLAGLILAALAPTGEHLAPLIEATERPGASFPVEWNRFFSAPTPHYEIILNASKFLRARARTYIARGGGENAAKDLIHHFRLGEHMRRQPLWIALLIRSAILKSALKTLEDGLAWKVWSDAELASIQAVMPAGKFVEEFQFALQSERAMFNESLEAALRGDPEQLKSFFAPDPVAGEQDKFAIVRLAPFRPAVIRDNQLEWNLYQDELIARYPPGAKVYELDRPFAHSPDRFEGLMARWYFKLMRDSGGLVERLELQVIYMNNQLLLACIAVALERHRLAHGKYPTELTALVPQYLEAVPDDILTGEPFIYRPINGEAFQLYSVALNRKDDGGRVQPVGDIKHRLYVSDRDNLDWPWPDTPPPFPAIAPPASVPSTPASFSP